MTKFDEQHVAGSSLSDCVNITFRSAYGYIHSGYSVESESKQTKLLSEVTATDLLLNTSFREFEFTTAPTVTGTHTITFSLTTEQGETFEASVEIDF